MAVLKDKVFKSRVYLRAQFLYRLAMLPKQTHPLAVENVRALTANNFPKMAGLCSKFQRICFEAAYPGLSFPVPHGTAIESFKSLSKVYKALPPNLIPREGDLLFKLTGSGGSGHVGCFLKGGMVSENSSVHDDDDGDARGLRTLSEFGKFDAIIRKL